MILSCFLQLMANIYLSSVDMLNDYMNTTIFILIKVTPTPFEWGKMLPTGSKFAFEHRIFLYLPKFFLKNTILILISRICELQRVFIRINMVGNH